MTYGTQEASSKISELQIILGRRVEFREPLKNQDNNCDGSNGKVGNHWERDSVGRKKKTASLKMILNRAKTRVEPARKLLKEANKKS